MNLPSGYDVMIRRADRGLYYEELEGRYERRLAARMVEEGWLVQEYGPWTGRLLYRPTGKAVARVAL